MLTKLFKSLVYSVKGLVETYKKELSFRLEVWAGTLFIIFAYLFWPLKSWELLFLILSYLLILITELINTAIEAVWKIAHPDFHETVGFSKDAASAAVFLAICFSIAVTAIIIASRLNWLL